MRGALLAVAAVGCNQFYGLEATVSFDGRPNAMCPALGTSVPTFYGDQHQLPLPACNHYSPGFDGKKAIAYCSSKLSFGTLDDKLAPITAEPAVSPGYPPQLSPEGDRIAIIAYDFAIPGYWLTEYAAGADEIWRPVGAKLAVAHADDHVTNITRGPDRRFIYQYWDANAAVWSLVEMADSGNGWTEIMRYSRDVVAPPLVAIEEPRLSPDGLRMLFSAYVFIDDDAGNRVQVRAVHYTDRPTTSDRFAQARIVEGVPHEVENATLSPDCGRVYFGALDSIFYVE